MVRGQPDDVFDLTARFVRLCAGKIDLVDDGDNLEPAVDGEVGVGQRLRLDALGGVHQQQRSLAGGQRASHFL